MQKGKHPFGAPPDFQPEEPVFGAMPDEDDFRTRPGPARRKLTPRDIARNRGVTALFNRIIPGLPIDADPPETRLEPEPFSDAIERTLRRLNIQESPWLDELVNAWPSLVPPEIAREAVPGKWDNGILYVYVKSSVKLFEIRRMYLKQIEHVVRAFAKNERVKQVRLMVNAVPLPFNAP